MSKSKRLSGAERPLERFVERWVNGRAADYADDGVVGVLRDVAHGCATEVVGELVYYTDTVPFYEKHQEEIDALLYELCESTGESPSALFARSSWDEHDPLARGETNKNLLAWFGFEETARILAERNGIEV